LAGTQTYGCERELLDSGVRRNDEAGFSSNPVDDSIR